MGDYYRLKEFQSMGRNEQIDRVSRMLTDAVPLISEKEAPRLAETMIRAHRRRYLVRDLLLVASGLTALSVIRNLILDTVEEQ